MPGPAADLSNRPSRVTVPNAPDRGFDYVEDFFVYEIDTATGGVAPGATATLTFQIQADSDFKLLKLAQTSTNNASITGTQEATRILPLVTCQITDQGSGRQLFSNPVSVPSLFGDGRIPFILPVVRIFKARATVQVLLSNYDTTITYNVRLSFIGSKLFKLG